MSEEEFFRALEAKKLSTARRQLRKLKGRVPRTRHLYLEGLLLESEGRLTDALKKFDMALVLHLSDHCIWFAKAKVLEELGRMDMAKRAVERAIRLSPGDPEVHLLYGKILYSMSKYPEARDEVEKSLEIQYKSAEALTLYGILVSIIDQDYMKALSYYDNAIDLDENLSNAWTNRGIALKQIGDRDGSLYSFQKALILNPEDSTAKDMLIKMDARNIMKSVLSKKDIQDDEEIEELEEIEETDDEEGETIDDWDEETTPEKPRSHDRSEKRVISRKTDRSPKREMDKIRKREDTKSDDNVAEWNGYDIEGDSGGGGEEAGPDEELVMLECPDCRITFTVKVKGRTEFSCPGCGLKGVID